MPAGERTTKKKQKNYILACRRVSMTRSDKDMLLASMLSCLTPDLERLMHICIPWSGGRAFRVAAMLVVGPWKGEPGGRRKGRNLGGRKGRGGCGGENC